MSARVKHFLSTLLHALKEERHFALIDGVAFPNRRLARNRFQARTQSDPGMKIHSYNDPVRLLSPEPVGWIRHHQLYSSGGADIVMESITLICLPRRGFE
jgi:hypothetical protein